VRIKYCPLPQDDPKQRRPDITRAESLLGWSPRIPLREGLVKTIPYFAGRLEGAFPEVEGIKPGKHLG
jgi:UDP-glucuronate decarboxylase